MATDLISVFLRTEPFSLQFAYVFRALEFFFDTEYYAILMSNYFTLAHFRTFARLLRFLPFCLSLKLQLVQLQTNFKQLEQLPVIATRRGFS